MIAAGAARMRGRRIAERRMMHRQQDRPRIVLALDPLQLRGQEFQLIVFYVRPMGLALAGPLEITPGSSNALLNNPMMRTKGASKAK